MLNLMIFKTYWFMKYVNYSKKHFFLLLILQLDVAVFSFESFKLILKFVSFFFKVENGFLNQHLGHFFFLGLWRVDFKLKATCFQCRFYKLHFLRIFSVPIHSGKTAAYMLPILERLIYRPQQSAMTRVLILTPTRELAIQVKQIINYVTVCTVHFYEPQVCYWLIIIF